MLSIYVTELEQMIDSGQKSEILDQLTNSVIQGDIGKTEQSAKRAVESGINPLEAIELGLSRGIREVGEKYQKLELYLPDMILAAEAMTAGISLLEKHLPTGAVYTPKESILIATVAGDIHDIGKNIVVALLKASGFRVDDLGKDVPSRDIVQHAESSQPNVIGLSAMLSTTMVAQQQVVMMLKDMKIREKYKVIIGGAPITEDWMKQIGADAYGKDANDAVLKVQELVR
jgi:corrinoid protein of di/trimethylamine methyltransferase